MIRFALLHLAIITLATTLVATSASAQTRPIGQQPFGESAKLLKGKSAGDFSGAVGFTVAPGVIVTPTAYFEVGHDSNPDQSFTPVNAAFGRTGTGLSLTKIGRDGAANVTASGSWLGLDDETIRDNRLQGRVAANGVYALMPGLTISAGGFVEHDEIDSIEDDVAAAFTELTYSDDYTTAFVRARIIDVQYLTDTPAPAGTPPLLIPLFNISNFDAQRREISAGILLGNNKPVAPYIEGAVAKVDYTDQRLEALIDRDADDYHVKGGLRVTVSPSLQADIGWRFNRRELDDTTIRGFSSSYFDGSIRWTPSPFFSAYVTIDRIIDEPSTLIGRLGDVKGHEAGLTYIPADRFKLTTSARRELIEEIGSNTLFRRRLLFSELTYDMSRFTQLYTALGYEIVEEDRSDLEYDRFRIGVGARIRLGERQDGEDLFGDRSKLFARPSSFHLPGGAELRTSVGYSRLDLASTNMTTLISGVFFDQAVTQLEDHSGEFDGVRTDVELRKMARHQFGSGHSLTFGAGAFYAFYDETETSSCTFGLTTDCAFVNIDDFDRTRENNTGPFGVLETTTGRRVHHWGLSLDAKLGRMHGGSFKDDPVLRESPLKTGLAFRAINQDIRLFAIDRSVPDPVDYREDLNTYYYGGFVGVDHTFQLQNGFSLQVDAEAGVYYAHTDYEGRYVAFIPIGGTRFVVEQGGIDDGDNETAFIGSVRLDLMKQFSWGRLGAFGEAEYLSYTPRVRYNNNDEAGGSPFGIQGTQVGTELDSQDAFAYTFGVSATLPIN
ncbi:MAG: outer membrane beta-barrel protein [Hyphomicrobiaceae bacterium]